MNTIPSLNGLRAVSILLVIALHLAHANGTPEWAGRILRFVSGGNLGVMIFFVISGFLITTLLLREKSGGRGRASIPRFYVRRFLRIFPVHYLYVAVIFLLNTHIGTPIPGTLFIHALTYTVNFVGGTWLVGHLWSLGVEEQFYLFWPWVLGGSEKAIMRISALLILWAPLSRVLTYKIPSLNVYLLGGFLGQADALMIGAVFAVKLHRNPEWLHHALFKHPALRITAVCLMWGVSTLSYNGKLGIIVLPFGGTLIALSAAYLMLSVVSVRDDLTYRFLNHRVMVYIGVLSYSLYIWQQIFLYDKQWFLGTEGWRRFPVNLGLAFLTAAASYHVWEKPFLKLKDRFSGNGRRSDRAQSTAQML
ncbi:MAG: acyltransferase [Nitrospirae bacterium]|nr:acyltransferase [Nitrospirota bacterium]